MDDLHAASAKNVVRADDHGVADASGCIQRLRSSHHHVGLGHGDFQAIHHRPEEVAVFRKINRLRRRADDRNSGILQLLRDVQRSLPTKLTHHALGLFAFNNGEDVLDR